VCVPKAGGTVRVRTVALYLAPLKETGGLFQYARTVAHALVSTLPEGTRLVAFSPPGTEWEAVCASLGIPWMEIGPPSFVPRAVGKLLRTLTGGRAPRTLMSRLAPLGRALHVAGADVCFYFEYEHYAYELDTPSLVAIHDLMYRYESQFEENRAHDSAETLFSRLRRGATGILVDSKVGEEQIVESFGENGGRVHILPFIPPEHIYDPSLLPADPSLEDILGSIPERYLFYPAQFWEHKNHIGLVDAVMRAAETCPDIHLVLVGSPKNYYEAVMRHIDDVGARPRVSVLGFVSDAAKVALYRRARAMVLPTFYAPTSIPPLEAIELGCAVAISRARANEEQLGDTAAYFDPRSVEDMANCLARIWSDDAYHAELVRRGHERAAAWGPKQFAARLWEIVDGTVGGPAA
jgi:glycosyltransferase involved in cell wall biosynthesis